LEHPQIVLTRYNFKM